MQRPPHVVLLVVGDELVTGKTRDGNGRLAAQLLSDHGFEVQAIHVVRDDLNQLARAIKKAVIDAEVVLLSGGLGPTDDDLTREAVARATGCELERSEELLAEISARFAERGRVMSESNVRQADLPQGSRALANPRGTAPGILLRRGSRTIVALPGVPSEFRSMVEEALEELKSIYAEELEPLSQGSILVTGQPESRVGERVAAWMQPGRNPRVGITARRGGITLRLAARGEEGRSAEDVLADAVREMREVLGDDACPGAPASPEEALLELDDLAEVAVVDGLGHGSLAARLGRVGLRVRAWSGDEEFLRGVFPELEGDFGAVEVAAAAAARAGCRGAVALLPGEEGFHFLAAVVGDRAHETVCVPVVDRDLDVVRGEARALDLLRRLASGLDIPQDGEELAALAELGDAVQEVEGSDDPLEDLEDLGSVEADGADASEESSDPATS